MRVHYVKKARKDYPEHGIVKGESYWWWKPRIGGRGSYKRYSKVRPRPSQTTTSEFLAAWLSMEERIEDFAGSHDDLQCLVTELMCELDNLRDELEEKLGNLPENFQDGQTADTLQERIDACDEWKNCLDSFSADDDTDIDELREELLGDIPSPP